ncbi:hypothetical protein QJQ45_003674 [Haematococcus lacustris]|nr:hypothetical protein QJQ45_003674 [Haematococcus lacustris]
MAGVSPTEGPGTRQQRIRPKEPWYKVLFHDSDEAPGNEGVYECDACGTKDIRAGKNTRKCNFKESEAAKEMAKTDDNVKEFLEKCMQGGEHILGWCVVWSGHAFMLDAVHTEVASVTALLMKEKLDLILDNLTFNGKCMDWSQLSRIKVHIEEAKDLIMYARHSTAISDLLRKQGKDSGSKQKLQPPSLELGRGSWLLASLELGRGSWLLVSLELGRGSWLLPSLELGRGSWLLVSLELGRGSWLLVSLELGRGSWLLPSQELGTGSWRLGKLFNERVAYGETGALYATGLLDPRYHGRHTELTHSQIMMADMCIAELASADGQGMLLSIPATSASTERVFSTFKHIWSDHRQSRLMGRMWMSSYIYFNRRALKGTRGQTRSSEEERAEFEEWLQHQPNGISE